MSRFDKVDPYSGGFRARLNAAIAASEAGKMFAVALNASGRVIRTGIGATADIRGTICPTEAMPAGAAIDVMTAGEIVDATTTAGAALTAGAIVYGHLDGTVDNVATSGKALGFCESATRVIVRTAAV